MMDQTEILKFRADTSAKNPQLVNDSLISNQLSKITVIKGNTYERARDSFEITEKTPKSDLTSKISSSGRLIRISSSKGINVLSGRPSSSEKEVREFVSCNNISPGSGGSEKTIKLDESLLMTQMRDELKKVTQVYEDKMNQQLSYQHNFLTAEIDHLKEILGENNTKLLKQQSQLDELLCRVETVQKKIEAKTNSMGKQLQEFKKFYEQCHTYTTERISQAQNSMNCLKKFIESYISTSNNIESWKYIEYANGMIKRIVAQCSMRTSQLKYYLNDQLYDMEIGIGEFQGHYENFDNLVSQMKSVTFQNQSLKEYVKQLGKFGINLDKVKNDCYKQNFLEYYEPKFREIVKKVNNATIEIDLLKNVIKSQSETSAAQYVIKIEELQKGIQILQAKMEENSNEYKRQISIKEETLSRSNPRILELQTKLHSSFQQEVKMLKQISELKLKISYLQIKNEKSSQREYNIQSTLAEAFAETLAKDKTKRFEEQISKKQTKIGMLEQKIKDLDRENYVLAEKLSKNLDSSKQLIKLEGELKYTTKVIEQFELQKKVMVDESTNNKKQKQEREKHIIRLEQQIQLLTIKLNDMIKHKSAIDEDDEKYFDELQEQVNKCHQQIGRLNEDKKSLEAKIQELNQKNQLLQNDLHTYAQTFQSQSMTFRTALQNLQKEKDYLTIQNKRVEKENHCLRIDIEHTKTAQSFYENNSNVSLQLRKTMSTDLHYQKSNKKNIERLSLTTKQSKFARFQKQKQYALPILCQVDETGYLKDEQTGCYFVDHNDNYFQLDDKQLSRAVEIGLILL